METDLVKTQMSQLQMLIADEERKMKRYKVVEDHSLEPKKKTASNTS